MKIYKNMDNNKKISIQLTEAQLKAIQGLVENVQFSGRDAEFVVELKKTLKEAGK